MCSLHFKKSDFYCDSQDKNVTRQKGRDSTLIRKRLRENAVPSVYPNLPSYLSKETPEPRSTSSGAAIRFEQEEQRYEAQVRLFLEKDKIKSFTHLKENFKEIVLPQEVHIVEKEESVLFVAFKKNDNEPMKMDFYLEVAESLEYKLAVQSAFVPHRNIRHLNDSETLETFSAVTNILAYLKSLAEGRGNESFLKILVEALQEVACQQEDDAKRKKLGFISEQLLLVITPKNSRKYSADLLAAALMWKTTSTSLYRQLIREDCLTLPSLGHLTRLSKALTTGTGLSKSSTAYLKARCEKLNIREKMVVLMLDEIYCAERAEYAGGRFFGGGESSEMCKTVLSFMVKSIGGHYSDMVALFPVRNLDSRKILEYFNTVMQSLAEIGYQVWAVSVDNAAPNRKFYLEELCSGNLKTSVPHPEIPDLKLFLLFDAVHNFKNVYNNFQTRKEFIYPGFLNSQEEKQAQFRHLEHLYNLELGKPVKIAYKLSDKVLHPTNIEKTNVLLADSIFHESTIAGLRFYAKEGNPEWNDTANFLHAVRNWWNILNVKNRNLGFRKRNKLMKPVTINDSSNLDILETFGAWLKRWRENSRLKGARTCLTEETFLACIQTTFATIEVTRELLGNDEFRYVLTGNLQSDPIERRFGWYRQLAGSNYFVSVRQILEAEKSIRLKSLVKYAGLSISEVKETFEVAEAAQDLEVQEESDKLNMILEHNVTDLTALNVEDTNIVFYIAGCFARSLCKNLKCLHCINLLKKNDDIPEMRFETADSLLHEERKKDFIDQINRGGLCYPSDSVFMTCLHVWKFYHDIVSQSEAKEHMITASEPRKVFVHAFMTVCVDQEETNCLMSQECEDGHEFKKYFERLTYKMFNTFMKNVCAEKNSEIHKGKKRSLNTSDSRKIKKLQSE